jgi:DNA processing protein
MEPIHILALEATQDVGPKTIEKALEASTSFKPTSPSDLIAILKKAREKYRWISVPDLQKVTTGWTKAHEIWKISQNNNIKIISRCSRNYPKRLSQISDPPVLLHVLGNIDAIKRDCIAIVGTREPTEFGIIAAKKLGALFAEKGYTVISGLANGIDAAAHQGALDANGSTVAVLAHGLDTVYPAKNRKLAEAILKNKGALVSEYPWGRKITRNYFVARDRIQSGLSFGIFVVETGIKGGTMHTVRFCKDQNRTLIVLKHPSNFISPPETLGNAQLISNNLADMVFGIDDINWKKIEMKCFSNRFLVNHQTNTDHCSTQFQRDTSLLELE